MRVAMRSIIEKGCGLAYLKPLSPSKLDGRAPRAYIACVIVRGTAVPFVSAILTSTMSIEIDIPELKEVAAHYIMSKVSPENVIQEWASSFSHTFDRFRAFYGDYIVDNWVRSDL
jgi:hypothetical protein